MRIREKIGIQYLLISCVRGIHGMVVSVRSQV